MDTGNYPMIDDDQNGTPIHALKNHLNNIGYVPNPMGDQMTQMGMSQGMSGQGQNPQYQYNPDPFAGSSGQGDAQSDQQLRQMQIMQQMQQIQQMKKLAEEKEALEQIHRLPKTQMKKVPDINHLVSDLNKSLDNYSPSNQDIPSEDYDSDDDSDIKEKSQSSFAYVSDSLKEPLLLLVIYLLLSQSYIQVLMGKYVKLLGQNENGTYGFLSILIYGIILVTLFIVLRKLLIK